MWEGKDGPQPDLLSDLSQTWKEQHPDWTYIFWNGEKIDAFMAGHASDTETMSPPNFISNNAERVNPL